MPEKDYLLEKYNKRYSAYSGQLYFTVFRVGEKFKAKETTFTTSNIKDTITIDGIKGFEKHNNRTCKVENCDPSKTKDNKILIGNANVSDIVDEYLKGVKLRDNSVIARELILSGGNGFYKRMTKLQQQTWLNNNIKFLEDNFGANCVYAILHMDETTPHLVPHALIVPKFWNEKRGLYELRNNVYFDGKSKMAMWQDIYTRYSSENLENVFMRGIRGSKAKHIDLQTYYNLVNENLDEKQAESVLAHAKDNYLNKQKVQELKESLKDQEEIIKACKKLEESNKALKDTKAIYEHTIKTMAEKYKIPVAQVKKIMGEKATKDIKKDKNRER